MHRPYREAWFHVSWETCLREGLMKTLFNGLTARPGLAPGSLVWNGEKRDEKVRVTVIAYGDGQFEEKQVGAVDECFPLKEKAVTWINVDGVHDTSVVEGLGQRLGIHPLVLEDILHTSERPKVEDFDSYAYIVLQMLNLDHETERIEAEQLSILVGENYVVTFQEEPGDAFDPIREQIRTGKGHIRKAGADYLAYLLIDITVDYYFVVLEAIGERIEAIEEALVARPTRETLKAIHLLKREMIFLRKIVWPIRDVISRIERRETGLFKDSTLPYLRDAYDHTIQLIDTIEGFRDTLSSMLDIYLSSISNRLNEVMKVLTIIATIFIPLTFLVGVYGMNFRHMPELEWRYGYYALWAFMATVALGMLVIFKRKKWM
jgi:magnesium transporter